MGVAQLYHHLAPRSEVMVVAKALIRLLRSHREVQSVVLNCIASISTLRKVCTFTCILLEINNKHAT
jgi:AP-3 complex subunit beta